MAHCIQKLQIDINPNVNKNLANRPARRIAAASFFATKSKKDIAESLFAIFHGNSPKLMSFYQRFCNAYRGDF